jgi:hypothetical protein
MVSVFYGPVMTAYDFDFFLCRSRFSPVLNAGSSLIRTKFTCKKMNITQLNMRKARIRVSVYSESAAEQVALYLV